MNGCRDELADRGFLVYGVCSAAYSRRVANTLGWSRRCATYFLANGAKLALPYLMCASQFSEAMNPSKWRLLRFVSVRDVFGCTCDIFLAAAGMVGGSIPRMSISQASSLVQNVVLNSCLQSLSSAFLCSCLT